MRRFFLGLVLVFALAIGLIPAVRQADAAYYPRSSSAGCSLSRYNGYVPPNAYVNGNQWYCNQGYYRSGSNCVQNVVQTAIPAHAYAYNGGWRCSEGYYQSGNSCLIIIPTNAHAYGSGWQCNSGYYQTGNTCSRTQTYTQTYVQPQTQNYNYTYGLGNEPVNGYWYGNNWYCDYGYQRQGNICAQLRPPANAYIYWNDWYCNDGYYLENGKCYVDPYYRGNSSNRY